MRAAIVALFVLAGCGNGGGSSGGSIFSASFGNVSGANTSGVAISTSTVSCTDSPGTALVCKAFEVPGDHGREVDVAITGALVAGMDYPVNTTGATRANVTFFDPTTYGTASGPRQWNALDGTGIVHVQTWDGTRVAFTYGASLQAFGSGSTGSFDLSGAASVVDVATGP